ncbi:MAG: DUF134 domain-containing protein [Bacteroidota bacterium]
MARPQKSRNIVNPPIMKGFKPYGLPLCEIEPIKLKFEEYESIKLINYEMLSQEDAATLMNVSRPTITRIYNKALKIIAQAFVEGKAIEIEGGNYTFEKDWFKCKKCHKLIDGIENHVKCKNCNAFDSTELQSLNKKTENE